MGRIGKQQTPSVPAAVGSVAVVDVVVVVFVFAVAVGWDKNFQLRL